MGILLIALGVVMLAAQFKQVSMLDMLLTWWPLILIFIGAEVLVQAYAAREEQPKIKYDLFSILIILIMVLFSIGICALTSTGVIKRVAWMAESSIVTVDVPLQRINADESLNKIVISAPRGRLDVKKSSISEVVLFGEAEVKAAGNEEARVLAEQNRAITRREGDTLFVQLFSVTRPGDFKPGIREMRYTLLLPSALEVEINGSDYFYLDIDGAAIGGKWLIKGSGSVNITVIQPSDLAIEARVKGGGNFGGNTNWEIKEKPEQYTDGGLWRTGRLQWGEGAGRVTIMLDGGEVVVNEI